MPDHYESSQCARRRRVTENGRTYILVLPPRDGDAWSGSSRLPVTHVPSRPTTVVVLEEPA